MGPTAHDPLPSWRRGLWSAGAPARWALSIAVRLYRVSLSGWLGGQCRYAPTCSEYALNAIATHGAIKGTAMAAWRVARCNPFGAGGIDPVPSRGRGDGEPAHELAYEGVIQDPTPQVQA